MKLKFNSKAQLVEALERQRPLCEQLDAKAAAEHKLAEKDYLATWKCALREAAKWSYVKAKDEGFHIPMSKNVERPACPMLQVEELDRLLHILSITHQESWTLDDDKRWSDEAKMARLLMLDAPNVKTVC